MTLFYLPILVLAILFSIQIDQHIHLLSSFGVIAALSYLNAQIGRKYGKQKEEALWISWDGAPSTQILRWRNPILDDNTKKRIHLKLQSVCPVKPFPTSQIENSDPEIADSAYESWVRFLIGKTRDIKKFQLLFNENKNYGFWRNLWALKKASICLIICLIILVYVYYVWQCGNFNPTIYPGLFFWSEAFLFLLLFLWLFIITKDSVRIPAFSYAERLMETVNSLD